MLNLSPSYRVSDFAESQSQLRLNLTQCMKSYFLNPKKVKLPFYPFQDSAFTMILSVYVDIFVGLRIITSSPLNALADISARYLSWTASMATSASNSSNFWYIFTTWHTLTSFKVAPNSSFLRRLEPCSFLKEYQMALIFFCYRLVLCKYSYYFEIAPPLAQCKKKRHCELITEGVYYSPSKSGMA